jgi:hypothetical protein
MRVTDALQDAEVFTEPPLVGDGGDRDAFEHSVAAGRQVTDLPDGAGGSGPEHPAQAVAGEVFEVHAQEDAPIRRDPSEVIHRQAIAGSADACLWMAAYGGFGTRLHSKA